jgi:hypothetical protein
VLVEKSHNKNLVWDSYAAPQVKVRRGALIIFSVKFEFQSGDTDGSVFFAVQVLRTVACA